MRLLGAFSLLVLLLLVSSSAAAAAAAAPTATGAAAAVASSCSGLVDVIAVAPDGTAAELEAASLLAAFMGRLNAGGNESAPPLPVMSPAAIGRSSSHVAIGTAASAAYGVTAAELVELGPEGFILSSNRTAEMRSTCTVVLAGSPNSTVAPIYAAQQLLRLLGVRFLAWDATHIPTTKPRIPFGSEANTSPWNIRFIPVFGYRNVDGWAALSHPAQARFMHLNDGPRSSRATGRRVAALLGSGGGGRNRAPTQRSEVPPAETDEQIGRRLNGYTMNGYTLNGLVKPYADPPGFVHTSYNMLYDYGKFPPNTNCSSGQCPPAELFKTHNEWFWPRYGMTGNMPTCLVPPCELHAHRVWSI